MKPLILTSWLVPDFYASGIGDLAITIYFRFVWGQLPLADEVADYLGPRTSRHHPGQGRHWSDFAASWGRTRNKSRRNLGLAECCQQYETVQLWFDTRPQAQLELIWLLDYFRSYPETLAKLKLRLLDRNLIDLHRGNLGKWSPPLVDVTDKEIATGSAAWQAYCAPTPEACFALLKTDLSALALLRPVLLDLLQELPSAVTGLGSTEMRLLELVGRGYSRTNTLVHIEALRQTRVFNEFEYGYLLQGLAHGPTPAVAGLDDRLRTIPRESFDGRMDRSNLSLTDFGRAVLAGKEDFSHHNPIDRWWGGTHLTNDNLWRYDPVLTAPAKRSSR
jgi:hypothetical protein